jgi:hypothetical protein
MTSAERSQRHRDKVTAAWREECEKVGGLYAMIGRLPPTMDDFAAVNPSEPGKRTK